MGFTLSLFHLFLLSVIASLNLQAHSGDPASTIRTILQKYEINGFEQPGGTDKDTWHSYVEPYAKLLEPFRGKDCNLLEIGVAYGGSALLWHEFLPFSNLFLLDNQNMIHPKILKAMKPDRFHLDITNAYSADCIELMQKQCPEGFDIIIDDGDHCLASQLFVLKQYVKLLKKGGILVIEDIQDEPALKTLTRQAPTDTVVEVINLRPIKNRYDDVLFVLRKI